MSNRLLVTLAVAPLFVAGAALAQTAGTTSGPATGKNVEPSAATQKHEGRSADDQMTPAGGGAPGVEARPGVQSGEMPKTNMNSNVKPH
ncbi:hypothetical protein [Methylocella sp.]|uniref:hypothetical protein n=1 Tax=Methylocella sp. TaxID=1978226 RepID=UPI003783BFD7